MAAGDRPRTRSNAQLEAIRRMSGSQRVALGCAISDLARDMTVAEIRSRAPALTSEEAWHLMLREIFGAELHRAAFPTWRGRLHELESEARRTLDVRSILDAAAREAEAALLPNC
jgi:hypothetical protein